MLVVISDLHFSDETTGTYNLSSDAFTSVFYSDIISLAKQKGAKEIKLLILGDLVDLLLTRQWLEEPLENRPWGEIGLRECRANVLKKGDSPVEKRCLQILEKIEEKNREVCRFFQFNFRERVKKELNIPVDVYYVPGNHDRLCNVYPSIRDKIRDMFGITIDSHTQKDENGEWWYPYHFCDETYGVFARHGHQYDVINYGGGKDFSIEGERQVSLGDVLTTEFFIRIIDELIQIKHNHPELQDEIIDYLKYVTDIRPMERTAKWLTERFEKEQNPDLKDLLDEVKNKAINNIADIPFVHQWIEGYTKEKYKLIYGIYKAFYTIFRFPSLMPIIKTLLQKMTLGKLIELLNKSDGDSDPYALSAYTEDAWKKTPKIRFILYGHTHQPLQTALTKQKGRDILYINTGTWRPRLFTTMDSQFVRTNQMTYAIFYNEHENSLHKKPGTLSFEWWNGNQKKELANV